MTNNNTNLFWLDGKKNICSTVLIDTHDYHIEQICVCDCFLESTLAFRNEVFYSHSVEDIRNSVKKIIQNSSTAAVKVLSLIGKRTVICCQEAVYQFDFHDYISSDELFKNCHCDLPFLENGTCVFYLEQVF